MIKDGITDPLDYPQKMDDIGGRTLAVKVKWQPNWKSGSVIAIMVDDEAIDKVQSQFPPDEASRSKIENLKNKKPAPELEFNESQDMAPVESIASADDVVIPMLDLSATDEIDPDNLEFKTPQKRLGKELRSTKRGSKAQRSSTFRTVVFPDKEKIEIPQDFKAAWFTELNFHDFAILAHRNGNNVFLGLHVSNAESFIHGGKCAALLYDFTEPTEVTVEISLDSEHNDILFQFRDFPNYAEDEDMFVSDTPNYCVHPHYNDEVFGWEKTIKTTKSQVCVSS
ncbi:hypothetical protein QL285_070000 [Trifolium repens]|nr:hypothetical protein QL285_070000 [Trifolium repens]